MTRASSPIRKDIIAEIRKFLYATEMEDATAEAKLFAIFRFRQSIQRGVSFNELCLILHPDRVYLDKHTAEEKPTTENERQTRQEIKEFRKNKIKRSIILYCMKDQKTGFMLFFNIKTLELFEVVEKQQNKIVKGIKDNQQEVRRNLKLPKLEREKLAKLTADEIRRERMERARKKLQKQRDEEVKQIQQQQENKAEPIQENES